MTSPNLRSERSGETHLIDRIRNGDDEAWQQLINRYEGRLIAYVDRRIRDRATTEDIVQEAFIGFLISLPNYDGRRSLEAYLFSICAYKLTDHLRRSGRRPAIQMHGGTKSQGGGIEPTGHARMASSIARSVERKDLESGAIRQGIEEQIERWKSDGNWTKLMAMELLFVAGWANKDVAETTGLSEQQIANLKSDFQIRLRSIIRRMGLDEGVFPELA